MREQKRRERVLFPSWAVRSTHNLGQENVSFLVLCVCVCVCVFFFFFLVEKEKRGMTFKSSDLYYP